jgi:hypothetical protein
MEDLKLIYIHQVGHDYNDNYIYQFIFSDTIENIDGEGWDSYPASGNPYPPSKDVIKQVGSIEGELQLTVVQDNEQFSMWDAIDGVVALGWENIDGLDDYPETRLTFSFGMKMQAVKDLLYERDINIKYEKKLTNG